MWRCRPASLHYHIKALSMTISWRPRPTWLPNSRLGERPSPFLDGIGFVKGKWPIPVSVAPPDRRRARRPAQGHPFSSC